jgi:hypothetical protein
VSVPDGEDAPDCGAADPGDADGTTVGNAVGVGDDDGAGAHPQTIANVEASSRLFRIRTSWVLWR